MAMSWSRLIIQANAVNPMLSLSRTQMQLCNQASSLSKRVCVCVRASVHQCIHPLATYVILVTALVSNRMQRVEDSCLICSLLVP